MDEEIKRWVKVNRPANGSGTTVAVTLMQGTRVAKWILKTSTASIKTDTVECYRYAKKALDQLAEADAAIDALLAEEE